MVAVHVAGVDAELAGFAGDLGHVLVSCSSQRAPAGKDSSRAHGAARIVWPRCSLMILT